MTTPSTEGTRPRFGELDGLRGLAALSVVLAHFNPAPLTPSPGLFRGFFEIIDQLSLANLGVVFFYVLSAFLLTYLGVREFDTYGTFDVKKFYVRRTFRIWPLYFVVLAFNFATSTPTSLIGTAYSLDIAQWAWMKSHQWLFVTFLSNWSLVLNHVAGHVDRSSPPLAILWSIAVEEQFYLFFPVLLYTVLWSQRNRRIVVLALLAIGFLFRMVFPHIPVGTRTLGPTGGMYYATLAYADVFLAGCVAGWVAARGLAQPSSWLGMMRGRGAGTVLFLTMAFVSILWRGQLWYPYAQYSTVLYPATGALFATVILWTLVNTRFTSRLLRSTPMRTLGALSYGIYLWHPISAAAVRADLAVLAPIRQNAIDFLSVVSLVGYLAATMCGAALTYIIVERPFLRLKDRFVPGTRSSTAKGGDPYALKWVLLLGGAAMCVLVASEAAIHVHFGALARTRLASLLPVRTEELRLKDTTGLQALFLPQIEMIPFAVPVVDATVDRRAVLVGDSGNLFLVHATGRVVRVVAPDGQQIRITNLGGWDHVASRLMGLDAVSSSGHWIVDTRGMRPLNQNSTLQEGGDLAPIKGFWMSPRGAGYTITRMVDHDGRFVRVTATRTGRYLVVTGGDPLSTLNGVPVSVRGQIRAHSGTAKMTLSLFEIASKGGQARDYHVVADPSERWTTLVVSAQSSDRDPRDNYSLGLLDVQVGDWFDIHELSVFVGILP